MFSQTYFEDCMCFGDDGYLVVQDQDLSTWSEEENRGQEGIGENWKEGCSLCHQALMKSQEHLSISLASL